MAPELETLDQLQCSDMPVTVIRRLFPSDERYLAACTAMLAAAEIRLEVNGSEASPHEWEGVLKDPPIAAVMCITEKGLRRIQ